MHIIPGGHCFLILLGLFVSFAPQTAKAQPETLDIRGIVTDSTNGERLQGVIVIVAGTGRGWMTNVDGFYLITAVPRGTQTVSASVLGYARRTLTIEIEGTEPITLNIPLAPKTIESAEVTVEGTEETETARTASMQVMTPHDLQMAPAAAQTDVFRAMELLPGISSTSDLNSKFYVRGGAGDQNLVLLDGMKLFNPFHAYGIFGVIDPQIVKSAEVYTGAFPANYGDHLSSVVNVTTRDGNRMNFAGNAGINFLSANLGLEGPIEGDNSWLVSARKSVFERTLENLVPSTAPTSFYDLFFKATEGNSAGRMSLHGFINHDDVAPPDPTQPGYSWRSAAFAGNISGLITDRVYLDVTVSYSTSQILRLATPLSPVPPASSHISEWDCRGVWEAYPESQDHFSVGFELSFPTITNALPTRAGTEIPLNQSEADLWFWFRYIASLGPFGLDGGINTDQNTIGGAVLGGRSVPLRQLLQPRLTLSLNVIGNWVAKASCGVYTQNLISINNEDDLISLFDAWVYLPDELRPEEADHYVLGVEGNVTPQLMASIQGYLKDYRSIVLYNPDKIFPGDPDYVSGTGKSSGIETVLRCNFPYGEAYASYVLSRARVTTTGITYAPRYDQTHAVKAMAAFHPAENVDITLRWEYGSGYPYTQNAGFYSRLSLPDIKQDPFPAGSGDPMRVLGSKNVTRLPAYSRLDAGVAFKFVLPGVRATAGVNILNVLNAHNILYYDRVTDKTEFMMPFFPSAFVTGEF